MGLIKQTPDDAQSGYACMRSALMQAVQNGRPCVLIAASYDGCMHLKKMWTNEEFSFGLTFTTLASWLKDRWELLGDGRAIVSSMERKMFMDCALRRARTTGVVYELAHTPGTISLLCAMAREDLVWLNEEGRESCVAEELTEAEHEALAVLRVYEEVLDAAGKCEAVQVMAALEHDGSSPTLIVEDTGDFTRAQRAFFSELAQHGDVYIITENDFVPACVSGRAQELIDVQQRIFRPDSQNPLEPNGAVRFLLPMGHYASGRLIARSLADAVCAGDTLIAVCVKEPEDLYERTLDYLAARSIGVSCAASKSFEKTDFGALWIHLLRFIFEEHPTSFQASDLVMGPFSDIPRHKACRMDLRWRADRSLGKQDYRSDIASASPLFTDVFAAFAEEDWTAALDVFEAFVKKQGSWTKAYRAEQQKALGAARDFFDIVSVIGGAPMTVLSQLAAHKISVNRYTATQNAASARVDIMSLDALFKAPACSYDTLLVCDLDAATYPVRDAQDAKTRLFAKLGNADAPDALTDMRRRFFKLLSLPRRQLICERSLNTFEADANYPAVMLEELLDCYRHDLLTLDEIDRASGLPRVLVPFATQVGEDELYRNHAICDEEQKVEVELSPPSRGALSGKSRDKIVLAHRGKLPADADTPLLSPSAIESYLECPYKWFALRRLRLEDIDAGFGPLEMGIFAHDVLRDFYLEFQNSGYMRVVSENLDAAREMLARLFDVRLDMQRSKKHRDNPLIALTKLEEAEIASLKKTLVAHLDIEAEFLPGFTPRYFEQRFGSEEDFSFAGCLLRGTIDRIDVNEQGQALVIDYKGSVNTDYAYSSASELPWAVSDVAEETPSLPHRVQTLLYAQAARKELGLEVVGSLYLSYGKAAVAGAYDARCLGPAEIPGINPERSGVDCADFAALLDEFEARLEPVLDYLKQGHIRPYPRGKDPCGFCPVTSCEMRR